MFGQNRILFRCLSAVGFSCLAACSALNTGKNAPAITLLEPESLKLSFSGKGSAAGVMLVGSMGPMGIAVGVAIDEGIAKDIRTAFDNAGYSLLDFTQTQLQEALALRCKNTDTPPLAWLCSGPLSINIDRLGFRLVSGEQDPAAPVFAFTLAATDAAASVSRHCVFPDYSVPLEQLKNTGESTAAALSSAINACFENELSD